MVTGIIGKKLGMTQLFAEDGKVSPATVIQAGPCVVLQLKTVKVDGYEAVQIGMVESRPPRRVTKGLAGHYAKAGVPPTRVRQEVGLAEGGESPSLGYQVLVSVFEDGERVDVIGVSRGKGFQGTMKRHNFSGGAASHGSMHHRAPGSIGQSSYPSRVFKGMKGPGRMGGTRTTVRNLKVLQVDPEKNLLVVAGAVPGAPGGYLLVRKAITAKARMRIPSGEA